MTGFLIRRLPCEVTEIQGDCHVTFKIYPESDLLYHLFCPHSVPSHCHHLSGLLKYFPNWSTSIFHPLLWIPNVSAWMTVLEQSRSVSLSSLKIFQWLSTLDGIKAKILSVLKLNLYDLLFFSSPLPTTSQISLT